MRCDARNVSFLLLQLLVIILFYTCQQVQPVQGYHRSLFLSMYIHASQSGDFVRARALYMLYVHRQHQKNFLTNYSTNSSNLACSYYFDGQYMFPPPQSKRKHLKLRRTSTLTSRMVEGMNK